MFPSLKGFKQISSTLGGLFVRDSSGNEKCIADTDGYLYQGGTKVTSTHQELNNVGAVATEVSNARNGEVNLNARLGGIDTQLAQIAKNTSFSKKILGLGSSVITGFGATDSYGWFQMLETALPAYDFINAGVAGDDTSDVIARFYTDVAPYRPDFVIVSLSLSNEGITGGSPTLIYRQYLENMKTIIQMIRQIGAIPIVCSTYPNNTYASTHYRYCKNFNKEMEQYDVAFINFMGSVDDLTGKWLAGTYYDDGHPNDAGHAAMYSAIPLSMFDVISDVNNIKKVSSVGGVTYSTADKTTVRPIKVIFDDTIESFTLSFRVKDLDGDSTKIFFTAGSNLNRLRNTNDYLGYVSNTLSEVLTSANIKNDRLEHHVALSYNKPGQRLRIYVDGVLESEETETSFPTTEWTFAGHVNEGTYNADHCDFKDVAIYRTSLNDEQISELYNGVFSKGSLEILSFLDDKDIYDGMYFANYAPTKSYLESNTGNITSKAIPSEIVNKYQCHVYSTGAQAIANTSAVPLSFNAELFDVGCMHNADNLTRITCKKAGTYMILGQAEFETNTTGTRSILIVKNGGTYLAKVIQNAAAGFGTRVQASAIVELAVNDYVELHVYQNSGGSLNVNASDRFTPDFSAVEL